MRVSFSILAMANNTRLVAYESGRDVWPATYGISNDLATQVRFDPRMKAIYSNYLTQWKAGGGTLMNQYTFCDNGWGLMKNMDDSIEQAPMYAAALEWIAANSRWWPGTRDAGTRGLSLTYKNLSSMGSMNPTRRILGLPGLRLAQNGMLTFAPDGRLIGSMQRHVPGGVFVTAGDSK